MGFEQLRFYNFRNLRDRELELDAREIFLVGENRQGKTNLLEAVHLLCLRIVFSGEEGIGLCPGPASPSVFPPDIRCVEAGEKTLSLQDAGGPAEGDPRQREGCDRPRELLTEVLCVGLVQQDMDFITGSPEDRRRFSTRLSSSQTFRFSIPFAPTARSSGRGISP